MAPQAILIFFHCPSNTGYAIGKLEPVFLDMARRLVSDDEKIHFSYTKLNDYPVCLMNSRVRVLQYDPMTATREECVKIGRYIGDHGINVALGFDQPVSSPLYPVIRQAGVNLLVSYWGAPMSSQNSGAKLLLKKFEVYLSRSRPDIFIFESKAMAETAIYGRGIPSGQVRVVHLGVDTERFKPRKEFIWYAHDIFGIPRHRRIVFYSGHMEERKGVHVIIEAAKELVLTRRRRDVHFLIIGNRPGEEDRFHWMYQGTAAEAHITFGGYRDDGEKILSSCYVGVIASTGWDSFTMSALEIAASGLPLIVSKLQGLSETIEDGRTGYFIVPGSHEDLADRLDHILQSCDLRNDLGEAARKRIVEGYSREHQVDRLVSVLMDVSKKSV
jgi:glycosyltransferase involved in cell wall biosynthesis